VQVSACFASADFHYSNSLASVQAHAQAVCNAQRIACTVILHDGTVPKYFFECLIDVISTLF
jgi:hypothetical protein